MEMAGYVLCCLNIKKNILKVIEKGNEILFNEFNGKANWIATPTISLAEPAIYLAMPVTCYYFNIRVLIVS